jgi:hypothetical protein
MSANRDDLPCQGGINTVLCCTVLTVQYSRVYDLQPCTEVGCAIISLGGELCKWRWLVQEKIHHIGQRAGPITEEPLFRSVATKRWKNSSLGDHSELHRAAG